MAVFAISDVRLETINPGDFLDITSTSIPTGQIWKIESAGIGGTKGALYLRKDLAEADTKIAILFSTIGEDNYSSPLPFWLP
ncbi:MAG TPA: hypothetical protein VFJ43_16445, partial [Bacteroidia bacterium]|nr:hypothetical protein [Bacteroidia bacterium]